MSVETQGLSLEDQKMVAALAKSSPMLRELKPRKGMFGTDDAMYLTALGAMIETRMEVETKREEMFAKTEGWADDELNGYDEVIIGGGPTATAYAAARVLSGKPRPLVITDTLGGRAFGKSMDGKPPAPWFRMNSSNRPGELGLSSEESALNVIPGSPVQGSMLNMDKYQDNTVQAFITRTALLRYADLRKGTAVSVGTAVSNIREYAVKLEDGGVVYADRVLDARGLGQPTKLQTRPATPGSEGIGFSERVLSVFDFADRFCQPFPFRDFQRVAVIGAGDTARVVVEALLGTGPNRHMSVPMLDWVEQIDWYGSNLPNDCFSWREQERNRYQDIGSFLRRPDEGRQRLRVFENGRATADEGLDKVYVSGRPYDAVIVCIGFKAPSLRELFSTFLDDTLTVYANDGRTALGQRIVGRELYSIGVAANLPFDGGDPPSTERIDNNRVALFRNLPRVVQLAMRLAALKPGLEVTSAKALRTTRKLVGRGINGVKVRLGDQVRFISDAGIEVARGTAVRSSRSGVAFAIKQEGYTFNGKVEIEIETEQVKYISVVEPPSQRKPISREPVKLGEDQYGNTLYEGDRVTFRDYNDDYIPGEVVPEDDPDYEFNLAVRRDDQAGNYQLDQDEYDSLVKE